MLSITNAFLVLQFMALSRPDRDDWLRAICRYTKNKKLPFEVTAIPSSGSMTALGNTESTPAETNGGWTSGWGASDGGGGGKDIEEEEEESIDQEDTFSSDEVSLCVWWLSLRTKFTIRQFYFWKISIEIWRAKSPLCTKR